MTPPRPAGLSARQRWLAARAIGRAVVVTAGELARPPTPGHPRPGRPGWDPRTRVIVALSRNTLDALVGQPIEITRALFSLSTRINGTGDASGAVRARATELAGLPALLVEPPARAPTGTVLFLHGGGYVLGAAAGYLGWLATLARQLGARVVAPDYRLGPEHAYPAAHDDAAAAAQAVARAWPGEPIWCAGDSAGAVLAIEAARALAGAACGLWLVSPYADPDARGGSVDANATSDFVTERIGRDWFRRYIAGGSWADPRVAPVHAELRGLPPTLIQYGDAEVLADAIARLCDRARACGVAVTEERYVDMPHDFPLLEWRAEARTALARAARFLALTGLR